jgi:hypothetical protein
MLREIDRNLRARLRRTIKRGISERVEYREAEILAVFRAPTASPLKQKREF